MAREGQSGGNGDSGDRELAETLRAALARASDTRQVVVQRGALEQVPGLVTDTLGTRAAVVVADGTTYDVAGRAVEQRLRAAGFEVAPAYVFPARDTRGTALHADYEHAVTLGDALSRLPAEVAPVAVGAGTVNDLTKLGAHRAGRPYAVVATAASVDGYAAFGAAITKEGAKQTIECPAPRLVVADVDVLAAAPHEMTASGFGDLLGKLTAGADWLVADAMGVEPVERAIWDLVQPAARRAAQEAAALHQRDAGAVARLFFCLTMSALAMQAARNSRPAAGAEHQLSHLWEMRGHRGPHGDLSHGYKVGVGTAIMAALYERLLAQDLSSIDITARLHAWPAWGAVEANIRRTHDDPGLVARVLSESKAKYLASGALVERLERLRERWPALRERLRAQVPLAAEVRRLLRDAGCPAAPQEIGLAPQQVRESVLAARQIRSRYTALDLMAEAGVLESTLDTVIEELQGSARSGAASW